MIKPIRLPEEKTTEYYDKIDQFNGGSQTYINQARANKKTAVEIINMYQIQDGKWQTAPGVDYYGEEIPDSSTIDGGVQFTKEDGTRVAFVVAGGKAYVSQDGGSWTEVTGATFTAGVLPNFLKINNILFIATGVDDLVFYNGSVLQTYTAILAPSAPTHSLGSGLSTGSYTGYYRLQAVNEVGVTEPSNSLTVTTDKHRDLWDQSLDEYVELTFTPSTGSSGTEIYWGEADGQEHFIGTSTTGTFRDYGQAVSPVNLYRETNDDNTTGAPHFKNMENSGARMWATYDDNNKWRVYWTGTGQYMGTFSSFYGGGWVDIEYGGENFPVNVSHYRTGKGDPIVTVLCTSHDGKGATFQIELSSVSVGDTSILVPIVYKIVGAIGTDCPNGVMKTGDNIMFPNKRGVFFLQNARQIFNVLSTQNLITAIRNKWEAQNQNRIMDVAGYYKDPYAFISLSQGNTNDTTIIYDFERRNWTWSWNIGFKQFFEYTDNNGRTHFLGVGNNESKLSEISTSITGRYGQPFYQSYLSPLLPVDLRNKVIAKVNETIFELGDFTGQAVLEVLGIQKDKPLKSLKSKTITSTSELATSGIGDDEFSSVRFSETNSNPSVTRQATTKKTVRVGKNLTHIQYKISAYDQRTRYQILSIESTGYKLPMNSPSSWRN